MGDDDDDDDDDENDYYVYGLDLGPHILSSIWAPGGNRLTNFRFTASESWMRITFQMRFRISIRGQGASVHSFVRTFIRSSVLQKAISKQILN